MINYILKIILLTIIISVNSNAQTINSIVVTGNKRISTETIIMFSDVNKSDVNDQEINTILKNLYNTNFFENVEVSISDKLLTIKVKENPIINNIVIEGVKSTKIQDFILDNIYFKPRYSYNTYYIKEDKIKVSTFLKDLGYYFSEIDILTELNENKNQINLIYKIDLGKKAKIKNIYFTGNKIFKDNKLKSLIVSEEHKPWKFISGKKYLNENNINFDLKLLKNFYLNQGYYDVKINSSFAKLVDNEKFELIFNIDAKNKYYFDNLELELPNDFSIENFSKINDLFDELKGKPYSINRVDKILTALDTISTNDQFESVKSTVEENLFENKINLKFTIKETEKIYVEKINILGNNITRESVLRNQLEVDEGDPYNEILLTKSINNLRALNFFKNVSYKVSDNNSNDTKIIDIEIEEKATGEIMAGAGVGTGGGTITAGVKENNYLGKGITINTNLTLKDDSIKGLFSVTNPNFNNTDKVLYTSIESSELDKLSVFGYKTNKTGLSLGTRFEFYDDIDFGIGINSFLEKIHTDSSASALQKKQKGNYFDNFLKLEFDNDKRNQRFQPSEGYRVFYQTDIPLISDSNTFSNVISYSKYNDIFDKNILKSSFYFKSSNSLSGDNIKLSERINIPSSRLRGFEYGKVGPKDGNDYVGGNYVSALNFSSSLPQIFENSQSTDFTIFLDMANVWGVDYSSGLDNSEEIRSSIGINLDWFSAIGPLSFSLAQPITKDKTDKTETFRFNLGTTF